MFKERGNRKEFELQRAKKDSPGTHLGWRSRFHVVPQHRALTVFQLTAVIVPAANVVLQWTKIGTSELQKISIDATTLLVGRAKNNLLPQLNNL